jgi:2,4-dienoyl-CoA reductase-like NADH-dependent reductase (Old Yellow Enzyme family)/thioredoxin reductase
VDFSPLFKPLVIGHGAKKLILKNRMVMAPMVTCLANSQGEVTPRMVDYYAERAKGGIGTVIVEAMDVEERMIPNRLGIFHDRFINELENLAASIREKGAAVIAQIYHTGLRGNLPGPDDLSAAQIRECLESFIRAAERVKKAGFNGVMIHGGHGYLISSFFSPLTNHRQDEYGGSHLPRAKFAVEVIKSVRNSVGEEFPIFFRMNGEDYLPGGFGVEDALATAPIIEGAGVDVISIAGGAGTMPQNPSWGNEKSFSYLIPPMFFPRGCRVEVGAKIKKFLKVPMSISGRINDPFLACNIITQEKADLVDLGRQMIADPYFPQKIADGRVDDIRQCLACNYCHGKRMRLFKQIRCAINPLAGREAEAKDVKAPLSGEKVIIVGGGIAGMQAAIGLKKRGYRVSLFEKGKRLGGQALLAALPPHKEEIGHFRDFLGRQVEKLGVKVNLTCEVTPELILRENPSTVVIATGGKQIWPQNISMDEKMKCLNAWEVLSGKEKILGKKIVVLGGGFVAAEISDYICEKKLAGEVTIVEMREAIALDLEPISRQVLIERLQNFGVKMIPHFFIEEVTANGVIGRDMKSKNKKEIEADSVIVALGTESVEFPIQAIQNKGIKILCIGDAREPRGIAEAVREGYLAGVSV